MKDTSVFNLLKLIECENSQLNYIYFHTDSNETKNKLLRRNTNRRTIKEPYISKPLLRKICSLNPCPDEGFISLDDKGKIIYLTMLVNEIDKDVMPAIREALNPNLTTYSGSIYDLEDFINKYLDPIKIDTVNEHWHFRKIKNREPEEGPKSYYRIVAEELYEFIDKKGLANFMICDNCKRPYIWNRIVKNEKLHKFCSSICSERYRRKIR